MCGFADFRKDFCGFFRIFGKVYEDFWSDTLLVLNQKSHRFLLATMLWTFINYGFLEDHINFTPAI